jgi:Tfp pilus assembly protein PilN
MAVQFNLLPDVKLELDRQVRTKHFIYTVTFLASAAAIALVVVSFFAVNILQKKLLNDANNDINKYSQQLKSIPNLDKVLTIQNQLNSLPALHQQKHQTSLLFTYLPQLTPTKISIGKLTLDNTANTLDVSGTADTVETINKFIDTLKFTSYKIAGDQNTKKPAFSNVVLTKVDRDDKGASYTIDANFDPLLFSGKNITLVVPQQTTTRSVINAPSADSPLFNGQTQTQTQSQKQGAQ